MPDFSHSSFAFRGTPYGEPVNVSRSLDVRGGGARSWLLMACTECLHAGGMVTLSVDTPAEETAFREALARRSVRKASSSGKLPSATPVFGDYDFAETVGLWLEYAHQPAAALLSPYISPDGFAFTPAEYLELKERLDLTLRRYARLPEVSKALEDLNTGFFRHQSLEESQTFINDHLRDYLEQANALHRDYLLAINGHARASLLAARLRHRKREQSLPALQASSEKLRQLTGRKARKQQAELATTWTNYQREYHGEPSGEIPATYADWQTTLAVETALLADKYRTLARDNRAAALSLSHLTADPAFANPNHLRSLADRLADLVRQIDEAGLYQLPLGGTDAATTPRQLQLLESLLDRLRNTQRHLGELTDFYARRHFWYDQPARLRRLLAPLLDLPAADWEIAFSNWYFERCLERVDLPEKIPALESDKTSATRLQPAGNRLRVVDSATGIPDPRRPGEILISLLSGPLPPAWLEHVVLRLRPLQDVAAKLVNLAGGRQAGHQLFLQPYAPEEAPSWSAVYVREPPPTGGSGLCFQRKDTDDWHSFTEWSRDPLQHLRWYFPQEIGTEGSAFILEEWPYFLALAPRISIFHGWSPDQITQALLSDGFSTDFILAAFLRAAEAADTAPFDREALVAIGREVRTRCGLKEPPVHPLVQHLLLPLRRHLPNCFFRLHHPWRDTFLPLLITTPEQKKYVLLPDGRLPGNDDLITQRARREELTAAGFSWLEVQAERLWMDQRAEVERILGAVAGAK